MDEVIYFLFSFLLFETIFISTVLFSLEPHLLPDTIIVIHQSSSPVTDLKYS